ncbi:MAG: rRNA maturation RNase YbeY [Muribaculaceae bacterium]
MEMPVFNQDVITQWIESVARSFNKSVGALTYIFCNDNKILEVNNQYLHHDYFTDIITFDYSRPHRISGDMFISIDTVASNATLFNRDYNDELMRVIIHGVLHLCGINDKGEGERAIMERHENEALLLLSK